MTLNPGARFNAQISEEAAEWFVEFRTGDVDDVGRQAFDAWVRTSQEHLRAYLECAAIWNESGSLDLSRALDVEALIALARGSDNVVRFDVETAKATPSEPTARPGNQRTSRAARWAIAASVAFVMLGSAAIYLIQMRSAATYVTGIGEQRSVRLEDGSTIELNSRSRLRVDFSDAQRTVELLEGQAMFDVAKDVSRPFVVRSGDASVRAVGTQFDVYRKASGTVVTVVEGKVAVQPVASVVDSASAMLGKHRNLPASNASTDVSTTVSTHGGEAADHVLLSAGEQLEVAGRAPSIPQQVNVSAATAWVQRQIVLDSMPLEQVAEEFNRYSTRRLVVEDTAGDELQLSGVFSTDPEFLIRYLRERSDVTVYETPAEIRIVRRD
jgi:transmembrane sensor